METSISTIRRGALAILVATGLSACAAQPPVEDAAVTRTAPPEAGIETVAAAPVAPRFSVEEINVKVPRNLRVSERNSYYPGGDIVWREDPIGDRHKQVADIVYGGLKKGADRLEGERAVILDVVVRRFHALSEKARYTIGGVHAIQFDLTVRDAATGEVLVPEQRIKADFDALGGMAAIAAEQRGVTQKVRITDHLAKVIEEELSTEDGYSEQATGFFGAINQI